MGYFEIACGLITAAFLFYYYCTSTFNFWKKRGVNGPNPIPLFGNILSVVFRKISIGEYTEHIYQKFRAEPCIGIYTFRRPVLILSNPEMIKTVLIKDFSKFSNRGVPVNEKADPLSAHLFSLETERWRPLRLKLSPVFTTGKLKDMFAMIADCSAELDSYLKKCLAKDEVVEIRDLTARFTTDVIGTCAFGVDAMALKDKESEFRRMGKMVFDPNGINIFKFRLQQFAPSLGTLLAYIAPGTEINNFFTNLIMDTIRYRKENNIIRNDFVNTLMELCSHPEKIDIELTESLIASQAFVFFGAGFETSSTTMSHALYELALNPSIQDKLREEIREFCGQTVTDLQYENIKKMEYLDAVFKETLRKYPVVPILTREASENYGFDDWKLWIPKDQQIWIPVHAIHHDPYIYPNPDTFDPERFTPEAQAARHPMHYLPFGEGPRNCIGARFGIYQTKVGLVQILRNYKVDVSEKTQIPYISDPRAFLLAPIAGVYLKITPVSKG